MGFPDNDGKYLRASVIAVCGGNLGSHCIGGFTENFSGSQHFCRYSLIDRETFQKSPLSLGPCRTPSNYNQSVQQLTPENSLINGIKFNSVFKSFHVCTGLPPCLGHDLFEGVVASDLALYIKHLVKTEKHFTYDQINLAISQTQLLGNDSHSKPRLLKVNADRLSGSAAQNWCFLRLLPILVSRWIKDPIKSEVWQLCLKLREITEFICAPKIHLSEVGYVNVLLEEYVHLRKTLFPDHTLKPKHHYLLHYPDLILQFGPVIRVWTLRFESKHSYFKECSRKLHNFLHLCKTLTERHQLLQAYLGCGELFPPVIQISGETSQIDYLSYNIDIQRVLEASDIERGRSTEVSAVTYKGTKYSKGLVVVLKSTSDTITFGKISVIVVGNEQVHFVVSVHESVLLIDVGVHHIFQSGHNYLCVNADHLQDYYPLPVYNVFGLPVVSLHHSLCSSL